MAGENLMCGTTIIAPVRKPVKGEVSNYSFERYGKYTLLRGSLNGGRITTSPIVAINFEEGWVETKNSIYNLVD